MRRKNETADELNPCPFCGVTATLFEPDDVHKEWKATCNNFTCPISAYVEHRDKKVVIKLWNRRAQIKKVVENEKEK